MTTTHNGIKFSLIDGTVYAHGSNGEMYRVDLDTRRRFDQEETA